MFDFYADHNLAKGVIAGLRSRGHSVEWADEMGLAAATDDVHLLTAVTNGRTLLTHYINEFILLHDAWLRWSTAWGIVIARQDPSHPVIIQVVDDNLGRVKDLRNTLCWWRPSGWIVRR